ncbi:Relaxin receptor 2 [Halotydeus destructor]|nr:Relaxin receptor 2 [Halotydeus destructor]
MKSQTAWLLLALVVTLGALVVLPLVLVFTQDPDRLEKLLNATQQRAPSRQLPKGSADGRGHPYKCQPYYYLCRNSSQSYGRSYCVERSKHCDNQTDCPLGDDETDCTLDDVINGNCPCHADEKLKVFCKNVNLTTVPQMFRETIKVLNLDNNQISAVGNESLIRYKLLTSLSLKFNRIQIVESFSFQWLSNLKRLFMKNSRLKAISENLFADLSDLVILDLSWNQITRIATDAFANNKNLSELELGHNRIQSLHPDTFEDLRHVTKLTLNDNPSLRILPKDLFEDMISLRNLELQGLTITNMDIDLLSSNTNLTNVTFSKFRYCLFVPRVRHCYPTTDGVSSLHHLLVFPVLRVAIWVVAAVTCVGNLTVLLWRSMSDSEDAILSVFVKNLSVTDFLMGVYLAIIGVHDLDFQDNYAHRAFGWMSSWQCTLAGFLAMLSSEMSVFILTLVAIDRYRIITNPYNVVSIKWARGGLTIAWSVAILAAAFPLYEWSDTTIGYYGSNNLCFPLHVDEPMSSGWQYSAFMVLGVNLTAVISIFCLYCRLFGIVSHNRKTTACISNADGRERTALAWRFVLIILTDCLCWLPIVVIKIAAFMGVDIDPTVYAWIVVFVLPVNSAINPVIYTLASPNVLNNVTVFLTKMCYWSRCIIFAPRGHRLDSSATVNGSAGDQNLSTSLCSHVSDLTNQTGGRSSQGSVMSLTVLKVSSSRRSSLAQNISIVNPVVVTALKSKLSLPVNKSSDVSEL